MVVTNQMTFMVEKRKKEGKVRLGKCSLPSTSEFGNFQSAIQKCENNNFVEVFLPCTGVKIGHSFKVKYMEGVWERVFGMSLDLREVKGREDSLEKVRYIMGSFIICAFRRISEGDQALMTFMINSKGKIPLGRLWCEWENNIKTDFRERSYKVGYV